MPRASRASAAAALPAPPPVPDLLFCEGCGGSFTIEQLKAAADGAVLCQSCMAHRSNPAPRPTYAAPVFVPPRPAKEKQSWKVGGGSGGAIAAGGGGLLVALLIIGKIFLRGCSAYDRYERRTRDRPAVGSDDSVPAHVQQETEEGEE